MMVLRPGGAITVSAGEHGARLMVLGGDTLSGPRHIWWNFVYSSRKRIEQAKEDWTAGRFAASVGDTQERIFQPGR